MREDFKILFEYILEHIRIIEERFKEIKQQEDFRNNSKGEILLDAITMRLQALSESTKKLLKNIPDLSQKYPEADWNEIIHFRDFISHHYELLDHQVIFTVCKYDLPALQATIQKILREDLL